MVSALFFLVISAFLIAFIGTGMAVYFLRRAQVLDTPNERSNHTVPVPRGGGVAVTAAILFVMTVSGAPGQLMLAVGLLAFVSFIDDRRGLPVSWRLLAQLLAVALGLQSLHGPIFGVLLPWYADAAVVVVLWLWMTNLTNFMDGIDGISAVEAISVCLGILIVGAVAHSLHNSLIVDAGLIAAAMLGFVAWNWHPARIFLGDVGSVPLGYLLGYLLLKLAAAGYWQVALILPAYYLADATITLLRRALTGKAIWQAHSEHFYQKAVRAGRRHSEVAFAVLVLNIALIVLASLAVLQPPWALAAVAGAYGFTMLLLGFFALSRPVYA